MQLDRPARTNFRNESNSEVGARNRHVRFPTDSDQTADIAGGPFRANNGHIPLVAIAEFEAWEIELSFCDSDFWTTQACLLPR